MSKLLDKLLSEYISSAADAEMKNFFKQKSSPGTVREGVMRKKTREARTKTSKLYEF